MGVLKHIDILGDALDLEVVVLKLVMHHQEVKGVTSIAPRLELRKKVFWADLGV